MAIRFERREKVTRYLDPREGYREREIRTEMRRDPLTGRSARVAHFLGFELRPSDFGPAAEATRPLCPFCPERVAEVTPKFPPDLLPEGRLVRGEAILFPNLSPYDEQSAVAVLTREHHVPLGGFRAERLADGFLACAEYFRRARGGRGEVYGLVSWNYMPPSGSTQIHPHLQAFLTETPGNALEQELEASRRWAAPAGRPYWAELVEAEERLGERFVARGRASVWLTAFVSQGPLSDLLVVFPGRSTLAELPEEAVAELAERLVQALRYLAGRGVSSFNLAFFPAAGERDDFWLHLRLSPRLYLAPRLGASDISSLQHLYQEPYMIWTPEELAAGLRGAVRPT